MRMPAGVQHHQPLKAGKPSAGAPAGTSCESRRVRRPPTLTFSARMPAGRHETSKFNAGRRATGDVLPRSSRHLVSPGEGECRCNYRLFISWSRVRIPSVPSQRDRSSVDRARCFTNPRLRPRADLSRTCFAMNAGGTTVQSTPAVRGGEGRGFNSRPAQAR